MKLWEQNFRRVEPYVPGEQPKEDGIIKLNTNENPYPPAKEVCDVLKNYNGDLERLYPDPTSDVLVTALADWYGVKKEQVFPGVGSDDVLAIAFMTFFNSRKPILFPDITYSFYEVWADLFQIPYERPALKEDFHIDPRDYDKENGGIVIANPNAPTSLYENLEFLRDILDHNQDVVVIVDEAYIDFGGQSALELLAEYENLLVVQTFSKSRSMAGARIGFAIGNKPLIKAMNDVKYSFNSYTMNRLSLCMGAAALSNREYFEQCVAKIIEVREWTKTELTKLGFSCLDSGTNFLFVTGNNGKAADLFQYLKTKKIYVRYFDKERIHDYLRITIGTKEEMITLVEQIKQYI